MIYFVLAVAIFFVARFVFVSGRSHETHRKHTNNNRQIFSESKTLGLSGSDVLSIENDPIAMNWVKSELRKVSSVGQGDENTRNRIIANLMVSAHERRQKSRIVFVILNWGLEHGLIQFEKFRDRSPANPMMIDEDILQEIWGLEVLAGSQGFSQAPTVTEIPDEVFHLPFLTCLLFGRDNPESVFSVKLNKIPSSFTKAKSLKFVSLQYCGLKSVPDFVFTPWLEELRISGNSLGSLPESLKEARSLRILSACSANLKTLPDCLSNLINLKKIDLINNPNLRLPASIFQLDSLERLCVDPSVASLDEQHVEWIASRNPGRPGLDYKDTPFINVWLMNNS